MLLRSKSARHPGARHPLVSSGSAPHLASRSCSFLCPSRVAWPPTLHPLHAGPLSLTHPHLFALVLLTSCSWSIAIPRRQLGPVMSNLTTTATVRMGLDGPATTLATVDPAMIRSLYLTVINNVRFLFAIPPLHRLLTRQHAQYCSGESCAATLACTIHLIRSACSRRVYASVMGHIHHHR